MSNALDFTYQYAFPSGVQAVNGKPQLSLATCNANHSNPYFFDGRLRSPRQVGEMLLTLSDVVRTHFFLPTPALLDPVLTSNENLLRLEGFSGCCGVYARVDLPVEAFEGDCHGRGTTNVDFNAPMRSALKRLRDNDDVSFAVGKDEVALNREGETTIEKKVKLPLRWIKGFSEVQAYQPALSLFTEVSAADALRFIRALPKTAKPKMPSFVTQVGRSIRLSQRSQPNAVQIHGTHRVKIIESLLPRAEKLRIWWDKETGTSAWEVCYKVGSFFLMISPEVFRGFSGEGQVLSSLANPASDEIIKNVRAQLTWQSEINIPGLAEQLNVSPAEIDSALAILGSRGLAGFDVTGGHYFHRELPFDLSQVEQMQPRLKNARKLVNEGKVTEEKQGNGIVYLVAGSGTNHRVELSEETGDRCTCPWFSKYRGKRGPCKHILAANIVHDNQQDKLDY